MAEIATSRALEVVLSRVKMDKETERVLKCQLSAERENERIARQTMAEGISAEPKTGRKPTLDQIDGDGNASWP